MNSREQEPGEAGSLEDLAAYLEEGAAGQDTGGAVDLAGRARTVAWQLREMAKSADAPDMMVTAVLDVIAPFAAGIPEIDVPPARVPVFLVDWGGVPVVPSVEGVRAMAEQIVTAIRTASGPSPLETTARYFADIWGEFTADLPDSYGCTLNCTEAEALADLLTACDRQDRAAAVLAAHAEHDQEGDRHYTGTRP